MIHAADRSLRSEEIACCTRQVSLQLLGGRPARSFTLKWAAAGATACGRYPMRRLAPKARAVDEATCRRLAGTAWRRRAMPPSWAAKGAEKALEQWAQHG